MEEKKPIRFAPASYIIRIVGVAPGVVLWTIDGWNTKKEEPLMDAGFGLYAVYFKADNFEPSSRLTFTFRYEYEGWEGTDYEISIV